MQPSARTRNARLSDRRWVVGAIIASCIAILVVACTDGTTPDCSNPEAGCSPDLSGSLEAGNDGGNDGNTTYGDAAPPVDSSKPVVIDAGDASLDAADAHG
jgi:hypothetical protein